VRPKPASQHEDRLPRRRSLGRASISPQAAWIHRRNKASRPSYLADGLQRSRSFYGNGCEAAACWAADSMDGLQTQDAVTRYRYSTAPLEPAPGQPISTRSTKSASTLVSASSLLFNIGRIVSVRQWALGPNSIFRDAVGITAIGEKIPIPCGGLGRQT